jgi:hypothetical protein
LWVLCFHYALDMLLVLLQEWPWQALGPGMTVAEAQQKLDKQRAQQQQQQQQQQQYGCGSDLLRLDEELGEAYALHQQHSHQHAQLWKE